MIGLLAMNSQQKSNKKKNIQHHMDRNDLLWLEWFINQHERNDDGNKKTRTV